MAFALPPMPAGLTHNVADDYLSLCQQGLRACADHFVTIDASALQDFDSSALAVLLSVRRAAVASGKELHVTGLPPRLRELAGLYGVADLLPA